MPQRLPPTRKKLKVRSPGSSSHFFTPASLLPSAIQLLEMMWLEEALRATSRKDEYEEMTSTLPAICDVCSYVHVPSISHHSLRGKGHRYHPSLFLSFFQHRIIRLRGGKTFDARLRPYCGATHAVRWSHLYKRCCVILALVVSRPVSSKPVVRITCSQRDGWSFLCKVVVISVISSRTPLW